MVLTEHWHSNELSREALGKASDPNTDQEVFRYSQVHALRFRKEIDDEVCEELEIRENLDRKELSFNERKAHALLLAAAIQKREKKRKQSRVESNGILSDTHEANQLEDVDDPPSKVRCTMRLPRHSVREQSNTLESRIASASRDVGMTLDLDKTPPEDLKAAAKMILEKEPTERKETARRRVHRREG